MVWWVADRETEWRRWPGPELAAEWLPAAWSPEVAAWMSSAGVRRMRVQELMGVAPSGWKVKRQGCWSGYWFGHGAGQRLPERAEKERPCGQRRWVVWEQSLLAFYSIEGEFACPNGGRRVLNGGTLGCAEFADEINCELRVGRK